MVFIWFIHIKKNFYCFLLLSFSGAIVECEIQSVYIFTNIERELSSIFKQVWFKLKMNYIFSQSDKVFLKYLLMLPIAYK